MEPTAGIVPVTFVKVVVLNLLVANDKLLVKMQSVTVKSDCVKGPETVLIKPRALLTVTCDMEMAVATAVVCTRMKAVVAVKVEEAMDKVVAPEMSQSKDVAPAAKFTCMPVIETEPAVMETVPEVEAVKPLKTRLEEPSLSVMPFVSETAPAVRRVSEDAGEAV